MYVKEVTVENQVGLHARPLWLCRVIYSGTISGGATRRFFCIRKAPYDKS